MQLLAVVNSVQGACRSQKREVVAPAATKPSSTALPLHQNAPDAGLSGDHSAANRPAGVGLAPVMGRRGGGGAPAGTSQLGSAASFATGSHAPVAAAPPHLASLHTAGGEALPASRQPQQASAASSHASAGLLRPRLEGLPPPARLRGGGGGDGFDSPPLTSPSTSSAASAAHHVHPSSSSLRLLGGGGRAGGGGYYDDDAGDDDDGSSGVYDGAGRRGSGGGGSEEPLHSHGLPSRSPVASTAATAAAAAQRAGGGTGAGFRPGPLPPAAATATATAATASASASAARAGVGVGGRGTGSGGGAPPVTAAVVAGIGDLQRAGPAALQAAKARMEVLFEANKVRRGEGKPRWAWRRPGQGGEGCQDGSPDNFALLLNESYFPLLR